MRSFIDLRSAARTLRRAPLFAVPVVVTLAVASGATATVCWCPVWRASRFHPVIALAAA